MPQEWFKGYSASQIDIKMRNVWIALDDLVRLKEIKDAHGKTPIYQDAQSRAWKAAREAL